MPAPDPARVHVFPTAQAFYAWLAQHHAAAPEAWIKIHKLGSGLASITPKQAIDVALCWGWIDGVKQRFDARSFLQRYTPRARRSLWSKVNVDNIARLTAEGAAGDPALVLQPPGLAEVARAKADGRWDRAYGGSRDLALPPAFLAAVEASPAARAILPALSAQNRYSLAFRLHNLKTDAARARKIADFVAMLERGETIHRQKGTSEERTPKGPAKRGSQS
jgi:uncharacterized protein YdeI (YjbR/CyaY-like superfamily)